MARCFNKRLMALFVAAAVAFLAVSGVLAQNTERGSLRKAAVSEEGKTVTKKLPSDGELVLTYFDLKGRAEPIRLAFHIGGVKFTDNRISHEQFLEMRDALPLRQVPVLRIGDSLPVAQSTAILIYAGRRAGLVPKDAESELLVNQVLETLAEVVQHCVAAFFIPDEAQRKKAVEDLKKTLPDLLARFEKMLVEFGNPEGFAVGDSLTIADIDIYTVTSFLSEKGVEFGLPSDIVSASSYPIMTKISKKVAENPKVIEWNKAHGGA